MSASRTSAASPSASSPWWRSIVEAIDSRQAPAAREHAADERVVDAQLAPLAVDPLLRRLRVAVHLARVAGVGVREHELADVVQQRGDHQAVALLVAELGGEPVGGALRGDAVQAEALGRALPDAGALEEVERARAARERLDGGRREHADGAHDAVDPAAGAAVDAVGEPQRRDRERDVGLDGGHDVGRRRALLREQPQHAVARLGQHRERLERLERGRQATAVALVVVPDHRRVGSGAARGGQARGRSVQVRSRWQASLRS